MVGPEYGWSSLIQFGVVGNTIAKRISHGPEVFMTSFALILIISFFLNRKITKRRKIAAASILGILFLGMFVLTFNTIWHMFQPPVGLHFRNVYFFNFIAIIFAAESYQVGLTKKNLLISTLISLLVLAIGYYFAIGNEQYVSINYLYLNLAFVVISYCLLRLLHLKPNFQYLLLLTVSIELLVNFLGGFQGSKFGREDLYQKYYQIENQAFQQIKQHDFGFYRVVNVNPLINRADYIADSNNNDPLIFSSNGVSLYSSTLNSGTRQMLLDLGYYGRNIRSISADSGTKLTDALFGVKYRIDGQKVLSVDALGIGTVVDKNLTKVKLKANDPIGNQEKIWQTLTQTQPAYFVSPQVKGTNISSSVAGNLYFVNKANVNEIIVNGRKITVGEYAHNNVIDLGKINPQTDIKVQLLGAKTKSKNDFYVLNDQKLQHSIKVLNKQQLRLQGKFQSNQIKGTVKIADKNQLLLLSVPYGNGWTATVDGQKQSIKRILGNLSYLELKPGNHQIVLKYRVPGLKLGLIVSLLVLALYIVLRIVC